MGDVTDWEALANQYRARVQELEAQSASSDDVPLPPVWDAEAGGWRCPYPHGDVPGLMAEPTRRLVVVEEVLDWRDVEDPSDTSSGPPDHLMVGESDLGDGAERGVICRHCLREVDASDLDREYTS